MNRLDEPERVLGEECAVVQDRRGEEVGRELTVREAGGKLRVNGRAPPCDLESIDIVGVDLVGGRVAGERLVTPEIAPLAVLGIER